MAASPCAGGARWIRPFGQATPPRGLSVPRLARMASRELNPGIVAPLARWLLPALEREIAAISTLVFDSGRSRCPSDLSKSAQVQLPKNADISGDYKFRTKTAQYRALEKNARRERISGLSASLIVQRFAD